MSQNLSSSILRISFFFFNMFFHLAFVYFIPQSLHCIQDDFGNLRLPTGRHQQVFIAPHSLSLTLHVWLTLIIEKYYYGVPGARWKIRKNPELTSSRGHTKTTTTYGRTISENNLKISLTDLLQLRTKRKGHTSRGREAV